MNDLSTFRIPPGLRPVRTSTKDNGKKSEPEATRPASDGSRPVGPTAFETSTSAPAVTRRKEDGRSQSWEIACKLSGTRCMSLPRPRASFCCCLRMPKVKDDERSASFLELSKLLLAHDDGRL